MNSIVTRDIESSEIAAYEALLKDDVTSLLYQSPEYMALLAEHLSAKVSFLGSFMGDELVGALPYMYKQTRLGTVVNSNPYYGSNGSFVTASRLSGIESMKVKEVLAHKVLEKCKEMNAIAYTYIANPFDQHQNYAELFAHQLDDSRTGQITQIPCFSDKIEEQLFKVYEDPRPRNIRKAQKSGIQIKELYGLEALTFLFEVHTENITAIGGISKKWDFFESIPKHFKPGQYKVWVASLEGQNIAAMLCFYYNRTVEYFTPATVEAHRGLQPSALLIHEAMIDASKKGFEYWNWGGTWATQGGVYDFKKKWGAKDYPYRYFTRLFDESILSKPKNEILAVFAGFYVVPFSALKES